MVEPPRRFVKALAFDKTGTLTEGRPVVSRVVALDGRDARRLLSRFRDVAAGTDVALETADVALMQDDLPKLAEAIGLSRSTEKVIKQNILFSVLVKGLFVALAPFGLVALWLAVLADMGTSIVVTLDGLRLFRGGRGRG